MSEWLNYAKEKIDQGKQDAFVWYSVGSRWFTMGNILLYVGACIVAGGMVGPVRYVEFLYHCCHFEAARAVVTTPAPKPDDKEIVPERSDSASRHKAPVYKPESSF